jgi:hypothetical protein
MQMRRSPISHHSHQEFVGGRNKREMIHSSIRSLEKTYGGKDGVPMRMTGAM